MKTLYKPSSCLKIAILCITIVSNSIGFAQQKLSNTLNETTPVVTPKIYIQSVTSDGTPLTNSVQHDPNASTFVQRFSQSNQSLLPHAQGVVSSAKKTQHTPQIGELPLATQDSQTAYRSPVVCNDNPIGTNDLFVTSNDRVLSIAAPGFLANDIDLDGEVLTATLIVDGVDHGGLSAFPDGSFSYTPDAGFIGTDIFQYVMRDASFNVSDPVTVTIEVREAGNRNPVGSDDAYGALAGTTLSFAAPGFLANDIDQDGDILTATVILDGVDHGSLTAFPDGSFNYTPDPGFTGTDQFQYRMRDSNNNQSEAITVTIQVYESNRNPVGTDDLFGVVLNTPLSIAAPGFLTNDIDPDGDALTATVIVDGVDHGSLTAFPSGSFTYTPDPGFTGTDQFQYRMRDSNNNQSEAITVTLEIIGSGVLPIGFPDTYKTSSGGTLSIAAPGFLLNDIDQNGEVLTATLITDGVDNGSLTAFPNGSFTYTPNAGFIGTDQFQYQMRDASLNNSGPITVTIEVSESNNRNPIGGNDLYAALANTSLNIASPGFLANDIDPDGDALTATVIVDGVDHGSLTAFPSGSFTYTPDPGFTGTDQFQYRMRDSNNNQSEAITVTIQVYESNRNPVGTDDLFGVVLNTPLSIAAPGFLTNDIDPDGDALTATVIVDGVDHGSLTAFPDGSFTYTPDPGFTGTDQFQYRMRDSNNNQSEAITVFLEVVSPNLPPVAAAINITAECTGPSGTTVTLDGSNSSDPNGGTLIYTWSENDIIIAGPSDTSTADVSFTTGTHQVKLEVEDECGLTSETTITITIEDITAPMVQASFLPTGSNDHYALSCSTSDICSENVTVNSLILIPNLTNPIVTLKNSNLYDLEFDVDGNKVTVKAPNPSVFWALVQSNHGVMVTEGQIIKAKIASNNKYKYEYNESGQLVSVKGNVITLRCSADDGQGNIGVSESSLPLNGSLARGEVPLNSNTANSLVNHNYPNPFHQKTTIQFELPEQARVKITIFDQLGRKIDEFASKQMDPGVHKIIWDAKQHKAGMYYYEIEYNGNQVINKMLLL